MPKEGNMKIIWVEENEEEPPSRPTSGVIRQSRKFRDISRLVKLFSNWLWASRNRRNLVCFVSRYGEYW